ncbi:MAG: ABC transporter substrate-binding protein [Methanosarcinales archaeon]|nr:ABC transporter substrate-binding protein [Methanosarcinales archaeon]
MIRVNKIIIALAVLLLLFIPFYLLSCGYIDEDINQSSQGLAAVSPQNEAIDVCIATKISATFSDTVNHPSVEEAFFSEPSAEGMFYWSGNTMTFVPSTNLVYNTTYTINIKEDSWHFKTAKKGFSVTIIDDLGCSITITEKPERIISLAPSNTEILFALGLGDKVVGVTEYCNYPPEAKEKNKVGDYSTPNIERVIDLEPDLVLVAHGNPIGTVEALKGFNLTVVGLKSDNLDEILYDMRLVGEITGQSDNAAVLVADMAQRIEVTEERMSELKGGEKPTVLHIIWHDPIWVAGKGTFEDELIRKSGGVNGASVTGYKAISLEKVIEMNPEVIITPSGTGMGFAKTNYTYEYIIGEPRLRSVDAVSDNRVYVIDADIVCRAGPRIADALEEMAKMIHPELYW